MVVYFFNSINKHLLTLLVILKAPMPGTWNAVVIYDCCLFSVLQENRCLPIMTSQEYEFGNGLISNCGCPEMKTVNANAG